jgi:hypothetical protein
MLPHSCMLDLLHSKAVFVLTDNGHDRLLPVTCLARSSCKYEVPSLLTTLGASVGL